MSLPPSASAVLAHLQKAHPHSSFSVGSFKGDTGETQFVLKRGGLSVSRMGCKVLSLRSSDNAILGDGVVILNGNGTLPATRPSPVAPPAAAAPRAPDFSAEDWLKDVAKIAKTCYTEVLAAVTSPNFSQSKHYPFVMFGVGIFFMMIMKVFFRLLSFRFFCLLIPLFLALRATCPPSDSFDVKKELKRVLRKELSPPEPPPSASAAPSLLFADPVKWFKGAATKAAASVAGEATVALGYDMQIVDYAGAVRVATVKFQAIGEKDCIWVGCFNKWYYMGAIKEDDKQ